MIRPTFDRLVSTTASSLPAILGVVIVTAAAPAVGHAQEETQMVDRIVAVVGDTAITQTEVQEYVFRLQTQGMQIPTDPAGQERFLREALQQKINELVIVMKARQAGITVSSDNVNDAVEQRLTAIRRNFRSEREFQSALNEAQLTMAEFRLQLTEQTRAELLAQQYLQQQLPELRPVPISEEEIQARFEQQREALGAKPPTVTLKQVIIAPQPSESALLEAKETAEQALSRLRSGEDFARIAREYSDDPGSREDGGELGWVRRRQLLPAFEDALYDMDPGDVSDIVRSSIGYHIIKLDRARGGERFAHHILIQAEVDDDDIALARSLADEVADALRNGADPDSLIAAYGDPQEQGTLIDRPIDNLPAEYQEALSGARAGDVVGPLRLPTQGPPGEKWVVARVQSMDAGGEWTLADVEEPLRRQVQQEKMLQQLVERLRESTYIEVRI